MKEEHILKDGCVLIKKEPYTIINSHNESLTYPIKGVVRLIEIRTTHIIAEFYSEHLYEIEEKFEKYYEDLEIMLMESKL